MDNKILSIADIEQCSVLVSSVNEDLAEYQTKYDNMIKVLADEEIVQTFFVSGLLGETIKVKFEKLQEILKSFNGSVEELTGQTKSYLNNQRELNNKGGN